MEKVKFKIAAIPSVGKPQIETDGYLFDNPSFPNHKFVIHKYHLVMDTHLETPRIIKTNSWVVSEYSTGMQIGGLELNTRKEAINYSLEYLSGWRKQVFASTVEKYEKINQ